MNENKGQNKMIRFIFTSLLLLLSIVLGCFIYYIIQREATKPTISSNKITTENKEQDKKEIEISEEKINEEKTNILEIDEIETSEIKTSEIEADEIKANEVDGDTVSDSVLSKDPIKVKGIYVTGTRAGSDKYMDQLIELVEKTELNAMIIDIKNDSGEITYNIDNELAKEIGSRKNYISNIEELVKKLKEKNIYLIARIVAFKDPILAEEKKEYSLKNKDGTIFRDKSGLSWVNPYKKQVWDYLVDIGKETARLGFDEIQFDYIRFSTDSRMKDVVFEEDEDSKTKIEVITEFTKYACERLKPLGIYVSADVYGAIINSEIDAKIVGQSYKDMSSYLDYICPMIYPSHYGDGAYGIEYPDLEPYKLILKTMEDSKQVLGSNDQGIAIVRPWIQGFTASWLKHHQSYGASEIREQIQAIYDSGYEEWIIWNGSNNYIEEAFIMEE